MKTINYSAFPNNNEFILATKITQNPMLNVEIGPVQFLGLENKPNHLFIIKTKPNRLQKF